MFLYLNRQVFLTLTEKGLRLGPVVEMAKVVSCPDHTLTERKGDLVTIRHPTDKTHIIEQAASYRYKYMY